MREQQQLGQAPEAGLLRRCMSEALDEVSKIVGVQL